MHRNPVLVYGAATEWAQGMLGREGSLADAAANALGALAAGGTWILLKILFGGRKRNRH